MLDRERLHSKLAMTLRNKAVRLVLVWSVTIVVIAILVYRIGGEGDKLARLLTIREEHLAWLFLVWLLLSIPRSLIQKLVAQKLGARLSFVDWYGLSMVTNLLSLVMPARGDYAFGAVYLKKKYNLPITRFGSIIYFNAVLLAIVLGIEGCVGLLLLGITQGLWDLRVWGGVVAVGLGALPFVLFSRRLLRGETWLARKLREIAEGWELLRSDPGFILRIVALVMASSLVFTLWMYVSYRALGFEVGIIPAFFAGVTTQMSFFFSLTPGNLGIREAVVGFVSQTTGLGFAEGVAVTVLQRAVSTVGFLICGGLFSLFIVPALTSSAERAKEGEEAIREQA